MAATAMIQTHCKYPNNYQVKIDVERFLNQHPKTEATLCGLTEANGFKYNAL